MANIDEIRQIASKLMVDNPNMTEQEALSQANSMFLNGGAEFMRELSPVEGVEDNNYSLSNMNSFLEGLNNIDFGMGQQDNTEQRLQQEPARDVLPLFQPFAQREGELPITINKPQEVRQHE